MQEQKIPYDLIRKHYDQIYDSIMERENRWRSPYNADIDFPKLMTPIEFMTWQSIRSQGGLPLYPQYPVGKYFADFGNPFFKVALECDGAAFHQDKLKDYKRDMEFKAFGWTVYRVTGADCNRIIDIYDEDLELEENRKEKNERYRQYYMTTMDGLIRALNIFYCSDRSVFWSREQEEACCYYGNDEDPEAFNEKVFANECLQHRRVHIKYHLPSSNKW
jgi:very-short-patch-repair endonuclease